MVRLCKAYIHGHKHTLAKFINHQGFDNRNTLILIVTKLTISPFAEKIFTWISQVFPKPQLSWLPSVSWLHICLPPGSPGATPLMIYMLNKFPL